MIARRISRRDFLKTGFGVFVGSASTSILKSSLSTLNLIGIDRATKAPNLVYIFADQLRACSVGCYQNDEVDTPNIDRLSAEGVIFTNAVSTSPICTPYRACLLTGKYPPVTGVVENDIKLHSAETCLAEEYRDNGYITGYIGKWHLNGDTPDPVLDPGWVPQRDRQGFLKWFGFNNAHVYYGGKYYQDQDASIRTIPDGEYEPDFQTDRAIEFITANRKQKFCLFLSIGSPHPQHTGIDLPPGGDYVFPYDPQSLTLRPNVDYADTAYARQVYADYYGMISNFDWNVGRILDVLDVQGLTKRTIVVVTSDHGDYVGSHFYSFGAFRGKGRIEAESLDVPFILRFPGKIVPHGVDDVFSSVDIMPTLLGLCRLPVPESVMGRDFSPLLIRGRDPVEPPTGQVPSTESAFVMSYHWDWIGVRTQEMTLEVQKTGLQPTKLFNNTFDPFQINNLVDHPDYRKVRNQLYDALRAWMEYMK